METLSSQVAQLRQLQLLRFIIIVLQSLALAAGYPYLEHSQQWWLSLLIGAQWCVVLLTQLRLWRGRGFALPEDTELLWHLVLDCLLLTALLYLAGGATNPFVSYYLVPIAVSAATLSIRSTALLTLACLLAYSALMFYFQPLQVFVPPDINTGHIMLHGDQHSMHMMSAEQPNWHIMGMWLNFGLSALLITWFVTRMASTLRVQQAELAAIREQRLRDDQLLGIATLAAGTVHELGTPLSTLAILAEDLTQQGAAPAALQEDLALLARQVERCKQIVQNLSRAAAQQHSGVLQKIPAADYVRDVLTHWQLLQPAVPLTMYPAPLPVTIRADATLEQALINLLNNAAEASPQGIEAGAGLNAANELYFTIRDFGAGVMLAPEQAGKPFVSTRGEGRGLGLFLARAAVQRLGGRVTLEPHPRGGTLTTVILPIEPA